MSQTLTEDTLVERYVAAVSRTLPEVQRKDVAAELRTSILDSVEDRLGRAPDTDREAAVRQVLNGLGDPAALSREYSPSPRHLIGPAVFDAWWGLLRMLWLVVPPIIVVVGLVAGIWADEEPLPSVVVGAFLGGFGVGVQIFFWVTGVFWLVERSGNEVDLESEAWSPDRLPPLPRRRALGTSELVPGVAFLAIVLAWLPWQHFRSPMRDGAGDRIPTLDPALWSSGWLWALGGLMVVGIAVEVVKYVVGSWTVGVTALVVAVDVLTTGLVVAMAATQQLVSSELLGRASDPAVVDQAVGRVVIVVALLVGAWSSWQAVRGHLAHRARLSAG